MPPKGKRPRKVVEPSNLESFFLGRRIRPDLFTFDATGNAIFKPILDAQPTKVFHLQKYEPASAEEIEELYTERQDELEGFKFIPHGFGRHGEADVGQGV